jgi:hypothetical protein
MKSSAAQLNWRWQLHRPDSLGQQQDYPHVRLTNGKVGVGDDDSRFDTVNG